MTVFKAYIKVMKRSFLPILIYVAIFTVITVSIALKNRDSGSMSLDRDLSMAVINEDESESSLALVAYLKKNFKVLEVGYDEVFIKESLISGYISYCLYIDKNKNLTAYTYSNMDTHFMVNQHIMEYLGLHNLLDKYGIEEKGISEKILDNNLPYDFNAGEEGKNVSYHFYGYFNVLSFTLMSILMIGIFAGKQAFYRNVVRSRILISGKNMKDFNLLIIFSSFGFVIAVWLYFAILGVGLFGLKYLREAMLYQFLTANFIFLLPTAGFAFLISLFAKNYETNAALTNSIVLPSSFLSGVFIPRELLPAFTEKIAIFSPMYWASKLYEKVAEGSFYTKESVYYILVLLFMALMFFSVALVVGKNRASRETA